MKQLREITEKVRKADAVLIGASNGLSITEGLNLFADDSTFEELFGDLKKKYGLQNILHGMSAVWPSEEEKWGFWSRLIHYYCGRYKETQVMSDLKDVIEGKDYFVVTSNGEGHFEMSGFDPEKIYEVEGNWLTMQCSKACHTTLYPTLELAEKMAEDEKDGKIPSNLVPYCPKCGAPMRVHMINRYFVPQTESENRFKQFLRQYHGKKLAVLELGIGWRNQLIKAPFMELVEREPEAFYVTINLGEIYIADSIQEKSYGLDGDLGEILAKLKKFCKTS